jgi:hypothetical protein
VKPSCGIHSSILFSRPSFPTPARTRYCVEKIVEGEVSTRPDAAITVMNRHALKENVGFSETKIAQFTRERAALCLDFARLAYLSKQAVDNNVLEALFFFQIHSFAILFYIAYLDTYIMYTVTQTSDLYFSSR